MGDDGHVAWTLSVSSSDLKSVARESQMESKILKKSTDSRVTSKRFRHGQEVNCQMVHTRSVAFPSNAKLIGPVHHMPARNCSAEVQGGEGYNSLKGRKNTSQISPAIAEDAQQSFLRQNRNPSRYQWQAGESGGGVYCKKSFWNLHRATHSRCPSAASTRTAVSLHSQGSHLSLHQSKPVLQQEVDTYLTVSTPLEQSPPAPAKRTAKSGPGSFSQYFMCFKPKRQFHQLVLSNAPSAMMSTHHSRNDNSVLMSLRVHKLDTDHSSSPRFLSGHKASHRAHSRHLSTAAYHTEDSLGDSVVSIQPAARPCTPAAASYRLANRTVKCNEDDGTEAEDVA